MSGELGFTELGQLVAGKNPRATGPCGRKLCKNQLAVILSADSNLLTALSESRRVAKDLRSCFHRLGVPRPARTHDLVVCGGRASPGIACNHVLNTLQSV